MPLVLTGILKIMREDQEGDSLLLYYLEQGETCTMTLNYCLGSQKSEIIAVAESDTELNIRAGGILFLTATIIELKIR